MYIQPDSDIKIFRSVPLSPRQTDTIFFTSTAEQTNYFDGLKVGSTLTDQSYTRKTRGVIRVDRSISSLYNCNYMAYKNTAYENKWFYAFITDMEYVNDRTTEIRFEIDVIQTWFFETELQPCLVEREHTPTDDLGDNLAPEPVELGEYRYNSYENVLGSTDASVGFIVAVCKVDESATADCQVYDGVLSGAALYYFHESTVEDTVSLVNAFISDSGLVLNPDNILSIYTVPDGIVLTPATGRKLESSSSGILIHKTYSKPTSATTIDGYTPRNKKLLTYPYNFVMLDNSSGQTMPLRYEFFDGQYVTLVIQSCITQPVQLVLKPEDYKGISGADNNEALTLGNYPSCSWNVDYYKAWLAQNTTANEARILSGAANTAAGIAVSAAGGGMISSAMAIKAGMDMGNTVVSTLLDKYTASIHADISRGSISSGNVNISVSDQDFHVGRVSITADYARRIDDFFSAYGYAVNRIKTPSRKNRAHYTYVKTQGCVVVGDIPADDCSSIARIHDAGIRYWVNGQTMFSYTSNAVL